MGAFIQPHSACHSTNNSWKLHAQHTNTCLLLPICSLCRAHVAKTKVRMRLGVSSTCHAGTNKQHSIARVVTHPPPLSHQHKQATTSLQLLARGWWCGCVKHASLSPSPHTLPTHLVMKQQRSGKGRGGGRRSGMGGSSHQQHQWVQSQPHGITAVLLCLHTCRVGQRGRGREGVRVSIRCVQITRCAWRAPTTQITHPLCHSPMLMACESAERKKRGWQLIHSLSLHRASSWHTPAFISSPSLSSPLHTLLFHTRHPCSNHHLH